MHYRSVNARRIAAKRRSIIDAATSDHEYDASGKVINFFFYDRLSFKSSAGRASDVDHLTRGRNYANCDYFSQSNHDNSYDYDGAIGTEK